MVTVTCSTLHSILHLTTSSLAATTTEDIIDQAIDKLNLYGKGNFTISNMSGPAGSKTVSVTSAQRGAIMEVASAIYYLQYRDPSSVSMSGTNINAPPIESPDKLAYKNAEALRTSTFERI